MPKVVLSGPDGKIEAVYHHSPEKDTPIAICLHPNPLQGGSMNNKVTHALYQSFIEMGYPTVKFNFRGVGLSEGQWYGRQEHQQVSKYVCPWTGVLALRPRPRHCVYFLA
jgi:alpha/beta superfamily hydrolase